MQFSVRYQGADIDKLKLKNLPIDCFYNISEGFVDLCARRGHPNDARDLGLRVVHSPVSIYISILFLRSHLPRL